MTNKYWQDRNIMSVVLLSLLLIFELIQQAVSGEFHVAFEHFERETFYCLASTFYLKNLKNA